MSKKGIPAKTGKMLEQQVADAYRAMGARKVEHDVEPAGHQIDVYVEMETLDHALHRIAVEAKDYTKPVGIKIVAEFAAVVDGLRRLRLVDEGVIVSAAGFSKQARNAAKEHGLRLLEPADLDAMVGGIGVAQVRARYLPAYQLPSPPADFIGRANELEELLAAFGKGKGVIIAGMGGMGKTALALALAKKLVSRYPDAQFYFDLKGTTPHPLSVTDAMTRVVNAFQPDAKIPNNRGELAGWYWSTLCGKRAILLMDDAASAEQVIPLIPPETSALLVTSRRHFTLPGLFLKRLEVLSPTDARKLMLTIAPRIKSEGAKTIAELCGHLPLALRVASSTLAERIDLTPMDYAQQLKEKRVRFEPVDASLDLSYNLLSPGMRRLWCMLVVFPDVFDSQAAAAVWDTEPSAAKNALGTFVTSSLIEWSPVSLRYRLHELVHLFVDAHTSEIDRAAGQERHAQYYLRLARETSQLLTTTQETEALAQFDAAWPNLRAAHRFLVESSSSRALKLLPQLHSALDWYSNRRGLWREHAEMLEISIHVLRDANLAPQSLGELEIQLGTLYRRQSRDLDTALEYCQAGLRRLCPEDTSKDPSMARHFTRVGDIHRVRGEFMQALRYYHVAERLLTEERYSSERGQLLSSISEAYARSGLNLDRALEAARESLSIHRELGDKYESAQSHRILADVYLCCGEIDAAARHIGEARNLFEGLAQKDNPLLGWILRTQGEVHRLQGDAESAMTCYEQALALFREQMVDIGTAIALEKIGWLCLQLDDVGSALTYLDQAIKAARSVKGARYAQVATLLSRVEADIVARRFDERAAAYLEESNSLIKDCDDLAVFQGRLAYLLKRSETPVGIATSVSAPSFDPQDALSYVIEHTDFRLVQIFLNQQIVSDRLLRQNLVQTAHREGIRLMCHAPGLLRQDPALNPNIIEAASDLLCHNPAKRVVYHFDEQQSLDATVDLITRLVEEGLVPCVENYHLLKTPAEGRHHYKLYIDLFRMIRKRGLNAHAVLDIPRLFDAELGLATTGEAVRLTNGVFRHLEDMRIPVLLHLIDSKSFDLDRSHWRSLGTGVIPYKELLVNMFASTGRIDGVIFEFEDKHKPLDSLSFLHECMRDGVAVHHPALAIHWWG